jgi:uncharacterized protein (DUF2141 family)
MRSPLKPLVPLTITVVFLLASSLAAQGLGGNSGKDDCTISGLVVKQGTNEPLKSARVQLRSAGDADISTTIVTDTAGAFEFKGIKPGRYDLEVFHIGFVSQQYGQRTPSQPGAILTLAPGQNVHDLLFRLVPTAVISGRVQNEDGEPLPWANVTAHRQVYDNGKRTFTPKQNVATNDRGEYRLFDLPPGTYLVSATFHPGNNGNRGFVKQDFEAEKTYVPIFYPSSTNSAKAEKITVRAGEEVPSIDFILQEVLAYRVRGHVVYAGITPPGRKNAQTMAQLTPRDAENDVIDYSRGDRSFVKADGSFELLGVLPGAYALTAQMFGENERHFAAQKIDVGNANVDGLQIILTPGTPIAGHVHWDGSSGLQNLDIHLVLHNVESEMFYGGSATVLADGSFNFREVNDGTYRVISLGLCPDCYLANVSYGGFDSAQAEIKVRHATDSSLEITYSSRGARVQGTVSDSDGLPSAGVSVVLVPDVTQRGDTRLYKSAQTDQRGQFIIRGIKPGDYKLFSWQDVEEGAWEDPDFLKPFEDQGQTVTLQAGDTKSFNIVAIPIPTAEAPKP